MNLQFHSAVIFCHDLEEQRSFYENFLKQEVEMDHGSCIVYKSKLTLWKLKDHYPISQELGYTYEHIGNRNLELCFETEDFEDAVEKVLMSELRILHNVEEESWGQYTIRFYDPEGNLLEIGESMKCSVNRMKDEGMDLHEIVIKTELPEEYIEGLIDS